ncbi:hypothetical protein CHRYSEOSP005_14030 [Chryseobacterium sp. Alg-005]|uniref:hypothetical protein n=1 Tax=Chryseobacterium sp. Alg-005 TaxID=3159516 RepID=UPI003555B313
MAGNHKALLINLKKDLRIYYILVLFIFLLVFDYHQYWYIFKSFIKFDSWSVYGDLRLLLKGTDLYAIGKDPFKEHYEPPYNYPSFWRFFTYIKGFDASHYKIIGFLLVFCTQSMLLWASGTWNPKKAIYYILLLLSPVSLLIFERGNNDLVIFLLLIFPVLVFPKSKGAYILFFLLAFMLKLYPIGAGLLLLYLYKEINFKNATVLAGVGAVILIYIGLNYEEIIMIRERTPISVSEFSFGFQVPLENFMSHNRKMYKIEEVYWAGYIVVWLSILFLLFKIFKNKWQQIDLVHIKSQEIYLFLIGAGVFLFSFFLSISWEYRLFFLLLCVPAFISWMKNNQFGAKYMIIILPIILWNQTLRKITEMVFDNSNSIFLINQLLITSLAVMLIVYMILILKKSLKLTK